MWKTFLMIVFCLSSLSRLVALQSEIMEKTSLTRSMVSYSQRGMKTMNQLHRTLLSSLSASRMRNIRQMNQVNRARWRTAMVCLCQCFILSRLCLLSQDPSHHSSGVRICFVGNNNITLSSSSDQIIYLCKGRS